MSSTSSGDFILTIKGVCRSQAPFDGGVGQFVGLCGQKKVAGVRQLKIFLKVPQTPASRLGLAGLLALGQEFTTSWRQGEDPFRSRELPRSPSAL